MLLVIGSSALLFAMVVPVICALWALLGRARSFPRESERILLAVVLLPVLVLSELMVLTFVPIERPLRVLLPWAHWAVVAASLAVLWRARGPSRERLRRVVSRALRVWTALDCATRCAVVVAAGAAGAAFVWAAWNAGDEHDGAMYRLIVAAQPYQDGSVGRVWYHFDDLADAYPRTVELQYSWTMLCLGNSVGLHIVNWYGLVVFGVGAYVMGRRAGVARSGAIRCAALSITTPMPIYLTGILYNDLAACAPLVAGAAFAMPARGRPWGRWDLGSCALALALGASSKTTVAIGAAGVGFCRFAWTLWFARGVRPSHGRSHVGPFLCAGVFGLAAAAASVTYVRSWIMYGSPVWPLRVAFGSTVVFDGPMRPESLFITASGSWATRWATAIFKLFQTTSQDANGAFGLLFAIGVLPCAMVFAFRTLRRPVLGGVVLLVLFWSVSLLPPSTNLRYSLQVLPAGYVMLHVLLRASPRKPVRRFVPMVLAVLLAVNAVDYGRTLVREVSAQFRWGVSLGDPNRNRRWYEQFQWMPSGMAPEMHEIVQRTVRPCERLVFAVQTLGGFLYDPTYSYAVEYRSIPVWVRWTNRTGEPGDAAVRRAWRESLRLEGIDAVLVYRDSAENRVLAAADSPFSRVYEQPPHPQFRRICIYRASGSQ